MATEKPTTTIAPDLQPIVSPVEDPALKTVLSAPKGTYATGSFIDNEIPVCSHCGDKESSACSEGYSNEVCPMLKAKPRNIL